MEREERIKQLKTITGHLLSKYDLSHHSCSHVCYFIKPQDVIEIVKDYRELLETSNIYISPASMGLNSFSTDNFKVYVGENWFGVKSKEYDSKNHFECSVDMKEVEKIEIDISCNTILSFHFHYKELKSDSQYSFRYD
ncbi:hypothetical protein IAI10_16680 [Clostridium sp. 19966]|uniref:hypothetical protein n=1 Tax=Clostridium sp. 19966 TaxID=2768166 RepID=UPI0028E077EB|nr:hypothetical protein [Clostridium sp. 19966]MDT8718305.1 hypothetical protein [Clostridium sp. 19966]